MFDYIGKGNKGRPTAIVSRFFRMSTSVQKAEGSTIFCAILHKIILFLMSFDAGYLCKVKWLIIRRQIAIARHMPARTQHIRMHEI